MRELAVYGLGDMTFTRPSLYECGVGPHGAARTRSAAGCLDLIQSPTPGYEPA